MLALMHGMHLRLLTHENVVMRNPVSPKVDVQAGMAHANRFTTMMMAKLV